MGVSWGKAAGGLVVLAGVMGASVWGYLDQQEDRDRDKGDDKPIVAPLRLERDGDRVLVTLAPEEVGSAGITSVTPIPSKLGHAVASFGTVVEPSEIIDQAAQQSEARSRLTINEAKLAASQAAWVRAKALYSDVKVVTLSQLQTAEQTYLSDQAAKAETQAQLDALIDTAHHTWGDNLARSIANQDGLSKSLRAGKQLLVRVAIPGSGRPPERAELSWDGGGLTVAKLVSLLPKVDPRFQQRIALYVVDAKDGPAPGANVAVKLDGGIAQEGALIPSSALVWWEGSAWVYQQIEDGKFARRPVPDPQNQPGGQIFVAGLETDLPVVVQGAQILLSEESRDKIQVGEEGRSK